MDEEDVAEIQEKIAALTQDTAPEENPSAEIDTSESLALRKGQRVSLTKNNPAPNALTIESRRECDDDLDIDASAFLLGADKKTHGDEDFIFYGNTRHVSGAVELDNGTLHVALKKIPAEFARINFTLTIYEAEERKQNFNDVKIFVRVIDEARGLKALCEKFGVEVD